jgi:SET domain-containing protein
LQYTWGKYFIGDQQFVVNGNSQYAKWPSCVNDNHNTKFTENVIPLVTLMSSEDIIPTLWYVASRDIHKEEELFCSYGDAYWSNPNVSNEKEKNVPWNYSLE